MLLNLLKMYFFPVHPVVTELQITDTLKSAVIHLKGTSNFMPFYAQLLIQTFVKNESYALQFPVSDNMDNWP